jgi:ABC-2 type transport system permease protein
MYALLIKEIRSFLSSLIGYVVITVFLLLMGLFMWVFPGNVLESGFANLEVLFWNAPYIFMFLIPAICMRSFSEEKRSGTIELLFTRPITDFQIILAKYLAGVVLVLISLLPTFIYYYSILQLGDPVGNLDRGGTWGSYVGLLLLGSGFVAIGIFASAISTNQVIAFIIAIFFCFFTYIGFEMIGSYEMMGQFDSFVINLGINEHYISMRRGVIDSRDLIYFFSLISLFLLATKTVLASRKW